MTTILKAEIEMLQEQIRDRDLLIIQLQAEIRQLKAKGLQK